MRHITIEYHSETDGWWAESPDVQGFSAAAPTFNELRNRTIAALHEIIDTEFLIIERAPSTRFPLEPDTEGPEVKLTVASA